MSDIEIGIGTTYDGAGVNAATASLGKLSAAQKDVARGGVSATSIMDGWTKAQYAGVQVQANLTDKAIALSSAVNKGTMTIGQAQTAWAAYNKEAQRVVWNQMTMGEKAAVVSGKIDGIAASMAPYLKVAGLAAGATYAVGKAFSEVYQFSEAGAQIQFTQQKFDNLSNSIGTTSHALLGDLRQATHGVYSDMQLMESATNFVGLGLANTHDEAVRLSAVAAGLGMNMNQLVLTLTNKTTMRFDALGVKVDGFKEKVNSLKAAGMDADSAFKEAFLQQAEAQLALTGGLAESNLGAFEKLKAGWANYTNSIKVQTGGMFTGANLSLSDMLNDVATSNTQKYDYKKYLDKYAGIDNVKTSGLFDNNRQRMFDPGEFEAAAVRFDKMLNKYRDLGAAYQQYYGTASGAAPVIDYASMLSGGMQLTEIQQKVSERTAALNEQLQKEQENLLRLQETGLGPTNEKYQEQLDKVNALKDAIVDNSEAQTNAMEQYSLSVLKNMGASDEQMLNFAVASGQITQDAANQQMAMAALAQAYMDGKMSAEDYANMVTTLSEKVKGLDGVKAKAAIEIAINVNGNAGLLSIAEGMAGGLTEAQAIGNVATGANGNQRVGGEVTDQWTGGQLNGGWTLVGDMPGGQPTAYSELISPWGQVFNARDTRTLLNSGAVGDYKSMAVGGDMYTTANTTKGGIPKAPGTAPGVKNPGAGAKRAKIFSDTVAAYSGGGAIFEEVASLSQSVDQQMQSVQVAQQMMAQQTQALTGALNNKLDELIGVMVSANPRAVGQQVFGSFAQNT